MRKPSEYIAAAVRNVQSRYMSDSDMRLTCGGASAMVTRAASVMRGENDISGDTAAENVRVLAVASDFKSITKGDVATLDDSVRIVTSVRTDCAGASCYIGLSSSMESYAANLSGTRGARGIRVPVDILAEDDGIVQDYADAVMATTVHAWTICIATDAWSVSGDPQIGDEIRFEKDGSDIRVRVSRCNRRGRHFILSARSR